MDTTSTFRPRPPQSWEIFTFILLVTIATTALFGLLVLSAYLALWQYLNASDESSPSAFLDFVLRNGSTIEAAYLLLSVCYFFTTAIWRVRTRSMLERFGRADLPLMHWAVAGWALLLGLSVVAATVALTDPTPLTEVRSSIAMQGFRVPALALLIYGIWQVRSQVRQAVAESGVAPSPRDLGLRRSTTVATPFEPAHPSTVLDVTSLPPANADFWDRVGALARSAEAELPLLESTSTLVRRWLLIPADGKTDAVRASVTAGAVLTVFPEPLRPAAETPAEPPTGAGEWFGLIEDNGVLRYQAVKPNRLPVWLSQARAARRFGLYRADAVNAVNAVVTTPASAGQAAGKGAPAPSD